MGTRLRLVFFHLIISVSFSSYAQNIECFGGANYNIFRDSWNADGHIYSEYEPAFGHQFGIGINDLRIDWITFRFTLSYDKYGGSLQSTYGGLGGGKSTTAEINKSIVSVGIYPVVLKVFEKIIINAGFELSRLIHESFSGKTGGWNYGSNENWNYDLSEKYSHFSSKSYAGVRFRIAYELSLGGKYYFVPQYSNYFSIGSEFAEFPESTRSFRQYLAIGIQCSF
ncbi:MAG: hypothetical protein ABFS38_22085 [Bacteroidota bacterium]